MAEPLELPNHLIDQIDQIVKRHNDDVARETVQADAPKKAPVLPNWAVGTGTLISLHLPQIRETIVELAASHKELPTVAEFADKFAELHGAKAEKAAKGEHGKGEHAKAEHGAQHGAQHGKA